MPAASRIGFSATTVCMVVQLGLATMPRWESSASGLTSETTSGTSSCMRQKDELSTTTAPGVGEAPAPLLADRGAGREEREVEALDRLVGERLHSQVGVAEVDRAAGRALGGERHHLVGGERALAHHAEHGRPHGAGGAHHGDPHDGASSRTLGRCTPATSSGWTDVAPEVEGRVQLDHRGLHVLLAHHARDLDRRGGDHLDVHARLAQHGEGPGGDARVALHPGADERHLAHPVVRVDRAEAELVLERAPARRCAIARSSRGTVTDMSAQLALAHGLVLDDHVHVHARVGQRGEHAPGDARLVRRPGERDARLRGGVRHGCDEWSFHGLLFVLDDGTGSIVEARSAVDRDAVVARVLDGAELEHARSRGGHLEHLLEGDAPAACERSARCADRR